MVPGAGKPLPPTDNSSLNHQEPPFTTLDNSSLMLCARQCQLKSRCQSFIFSLTNGQCSLFSTIMMNTTNSSMSQDEVFADNIHSWPSRLAGDCENHTCPQNTVCEGNMSCLVTHCVNPPIIANGAVHLGSPETMLFDIGQVEFTCEPYYRSESTLKCLSDGSWLTSSCIAVQSCKDVQPCDKTYADADGEYWILLATRNLTRVRIYCGNMTSNSPGTFVTLLEESYTESPGSCLGLCGRTTYGRVGINLKSLKVIRGDSTFFTVSCGRGVFGNTASCTSNSSAAPECGLSGTLRIDMRGTGFTVRPETQWKGNAQAVPVITHSNNWDVVKVTCYADSMCTTCLTRNSNGDIVMYFEVDAKYIPPIETAVVPQCP